MLTTKSNPRPAGPFWRARAKGRLSAKGFTLVEMLVGLSIFALLGITANLVINAALTQFARGFSFNQAAEDSRAVMDIVGRRLEPSAETPELITFNGTNITNTTNAYAMGIRYHRILPGYYQLNGPASKTNNLISFTATNVTALDVAYNSTVSPLIVGTYTFGQDSPTVGDRVIIMNEPGYFETITSGANRGRKPGRGISSVDSASGSTNKTQTIRLTSGTGRALVCSNACYFAREAALIAVDVTNSGITRRELRYYDRASNVSDYRVLVRYLDAAPVETDSGGRTILPFSLDSTMNPTALMFHAPVKITDYSRRLGSRRATNEYSSFIRTSMAILRKDYIEIPDYRSNSTN